LAVADVAVIAHERKVLGAGLAELREALADAGYGDPLWYQVPKSKKAPAKVAEAVEAGADVILVWGGDGTVQRCVDRLVELGVAAEVVVGILPAGTANLLAHELGVPIDLRGAVDVALSGRTRLLDVGRVNGEHFLVMAGTGFDALMIKEADKDLKGRFGRLAYLWTGAHSLGEALVYAEVSVDGEPWFAGATSCVLTANTGRLVGGVRAFPEAAPDDGLLEVGVVRARTRRQWFRVLVRTVVGRAASSPLVETTRGREVRVQLDHELPFELDGGDRKPADRLDIEVRHHAVRVAVPPGA
jgi:diacylglycerol kinase (ATP)